VDPDATSCVVCDKEFDVDLFQRLQPGFVYEWLHNIEEEAKTKNKSMPSTGSSLENNENGVEVLEGGPGMLAPIDPDRLRRRTRKPGDGHECIYNPKDSNGQCELCWKEHDSCDLVKRSNRCDVCYRKAEMCPTSETKPFYVVQKLLELHAANQKRQDRTLVGKPKCLFGEKVPMIEKRPLKVIVFSQFRKVLNMAGDRMLRRFGTACIAEYWGHYRRQELHKFIYEDDCFCMLLGKDGSEGLDLSFVTHIFFLEQVWDKSLEQQAVARAWRMGAKSSVEVETLIAESSVEATMSRLEQSLEQDTHQVDPADGLQGIKSATEAGKSSEYQRAKLQFLLKSLQLITNTFTTSFGGVKRKAPVAQIEESIEQALNKKNKKVRVRFKD
jgi:SNF2 family DNA or RNA helicase